MKTPLNYQISEYDCGPTTLSNALSYLFKREEIPPDVIKHIMLYCMDAYSEKGEFGKHGTSSMAMMFISSWLNQFGKVKKFPIQCEFLSGKQVYLGQNSRMISALQQGGVVVVRLRHGWWHYVLLTHADHQHVYLFDPYYRKRAFHQAGIETIEDQPFAYNRKVSYEIMNSIGKDAYAMGAEDMREATILFNTTRKQTADTTIEYFI